MKVQFLSIKFRLVEDAHEQRGKLVSVRMRYNPRRSPLSYVDHALKYLGNRAPKLVKFYGYSIIEEEV